MVVKPLFSLNQPIQKSPSLHTQMEDFDLSTSVLESLLILEDSYLQITRENMLATLISEKDGDLVIMQEGLVDLVKSSVLFFATLIKKIKEVTDRFFMFIRAYIGNFDKFLSKYKQAIDEAEPDFTINTFNYTFETNVPKLDKLKELVQNYNRDLGDVPKRDKSDLIDERDRFTSDSYFDGIRGYVLNRGSVGRDEFHERTRALYRNNETTPSSVRVDKDYLKKAVSNYGELKKTYHNCRAQNDQVLLLLGNLQSFFEKNPFVHYKGDEKVIYAHQLSIRDNGHDLEREGRYDTPYSSTALDKYNLYFNYKLKLAKEIGSISSYAVVEKIAALKEALTTTEKIVRRSVIGIGDKEGA